MALEGGDAVLGTGLAGAIARARAEAYGKDYSLKGDARGLNLEAAAIIKYLTNNAEVNTSVETEVSTSVSTDVTVDILTGEGEGEGTGTGTGEGSGSGTIS